MFTFPRMMASAIVALAGHSFTHASATPKASRSLCPPVVGTFNITSYQLYPENLDFDSIHCKIYAGSLYNASMIQYNPYTHEQKHILFPGISNNDTFRVGGIDFDVRTGSIYALANAAAPFNPPLGSDLIGPNRLIKYDTFTESIVYIADLDAVTANLSALAGQALNGYDDQAEDTRGNSYVAVTYGNAIVKVMPSGQASIFYHQPAALISKPPAFGYGGLAALGDKLIVSDQTGRLVTFDTTSTTPVETTVALTGQPANVTVACDGVLLPDRYYQKVILCSQDKKNAIYVYLSEDKWTSAKYIGQVANNYSSNAGGLPVATVQVADNLFISDDFFTGRGDRDEFALVDITAQLDGIVRAVGIDGVKN